jgi:hypothetical protein
VAASAVIDVTPTVPPRVVASSIAEGALLAAGPLEIVIEFSEEMATAEVTDFDVRLVETTSGALVDESVFNLAATTLTLGYADLPEGIYQLILVSSPLGFRDVDDLPLDGEPSAPLPSGDGVAGGDFVLGFSLDAGSRAFPVPLDGVSPVGALIHEGAVRAVHHAPSDADSFTLDLDGGQCVTVLLRPLDGSLQGQVELLAPNGTTLGSATAPAAGEAALLQTVATPGAGGYRMSPLAARPTTARAPLRTSEPRRSRSAMALTASECSARAVLTRTSTASTSQPESVRAWCSPQVPGARPS